jgi:galactokinase
VTGADLAGALAAHGLQPDDVAAKRNLFDAVLHAFAAFAGADPTHAWWIPGRVEVFGKHTDYCGGHSLVGALPRGFALIARPRSDQTLRIFDARRAESLTMDAGRRSAPGPRQTGWANYVHTVVGRLARNFPDAPIAADIVFASDLPSASGMSSSSALMVGLATALVALGDIQNRAEWRQNITNAADEAGYYGCVENGLSFGSLAGDSGVGTHGGSEDHAAIIGGKPNQLSAWRFVPVTHVRDVHVPDDWMFVIASSGVAADKTGSAKDAYNRLARDASALLDLWNRHEAPQPSLSAALSSHPAAQERLRRLIQAAHPQTFTLEHRLNHFVRENSRVLEAAEAFRDADRDRIGSLSDSSQADAEMLLQNQVPETSALTRSARALGAFGASSFGAGFGGSVWALIDTGEAARLAERWLTRYSGAFPARKAATSFLARPSLPLTRLL